MVITVTLNPLIDKTISVDKLIPGTNHRVDRGIDVVGGKGVNVSRAVRNLGGETVAITFIGGETGTYLSTLLKQEGIPSILIRTKSATRIQISILDRSNNKPTFFIWKNEGVTQQELAALKFELDLILSDDSKKKILVISGSAPAGDMDNSINEIIHIANKYNVITILDSYGKAFKKTLTEKPFCIKQNRIEAESYFGLSLLNQNNILDAINRFVDIGIRFPIITAGEDWVYAGYNEYRWKLIPLTIKTINPTGSGDAMVSSIALDMESYKSRKLTLNQVEKILIKAIAAGAANASIWLPCGITKDMVDTYIPKVKIRRIK